MTRTIQIAADRAYDQTKTVLPAEVARGVYIANPPSAQALKLMHLLIAQAGGRMADDVWHELRLSDIRKNEGMRNHDRASLEILFSELSAANLIHDDKEKRRVTIGGLLDRAQIDYRDEGTTGDLLVTWWFGGAFRAMAEKSCHWAIMDRQTVFALSSKYSILLYQHIASLTALDHITDKTFTVAELRVVLGLPEGKIKRFANLKGDVLTPAIADINQLSRLALTATPNKIGRTVASVTVAWTINPDPTEAKRELDRSNIGRQARLQGTGETPIVAFPAAGSVKNIEPWDRIARDNAPRIDGRHVPDLCMLADTFRKWCGERSISLDTASIEKTFTTWCKSYSAR